jgi:HEPN domain-containing protein
MNARAETVRILLAKAAQDGLAARQLAADPRIGDEVVGFHVQQAVEKGLKALLAFHAIPYRRTHDLLELMDQLIAHGHPLAGALEALQEMTPFAVEYRYETLDQYEEAPLDRERALVLLSELEVWIQEQMRSGP